MATTEERLARLEAQAEYNSETLKRIEADSKETRKILEEVRENGWKSFAFLSGISAIIGGIVTKLGAWFIGHGS